MQNDFIRYISPELNRSLSSPDLIMDEVSVMS